MTVTLTRRGRTVKHRPARRSSVRGSSGRLSGKVLPKGTYRVRIQATDLEGNRSKGTARTSLTVD